MTTNLDEASNKRVNDENLNENKFIIYFFSIFYGHPHKSIDVYNSMTKRR